MLLRHVPIFFFMALRILKWLPSGNVRLRVSLTPAISDCLTCVSCSFDLDAPGERSFLESAAIVAAFDDDHGPPKVYDWLLILPQEVEYIWCAPWNWSKVLYLLTRYISFATLALGIRRELIPHRLAQIPARFRNQFTFDRIPALNSSLDLY